MRMKSILAACSALSLVAAMTVASVPAAAQGYDHRQGGYNGQQGPGGGDHRGDQQGRGGPQGGDRRDNNGNVVAAGILGMVLGAAIADSNDHRAYYQAHQSDEGWHNRCRARYHSYDHDSGTYLGNDGRRHYCRL